MRKITLLAFFAFSLSATNLFGQFLVKDSFFETTGVSNVGTVSGYESQTGPYIIWNPDANTTQYIGGVAPGNGVGGSAEFSNDGNFLSGTNMIDLPISTDWQRNILTEYNYIFRGIEFPEAQDLFGYAVGQSLTYNGNGIVLRTTNGGQTWGAMWVDDQQRGLEAMSFPTFGTGYVGGFNHYFAKTENAGWDWTELNPAGTDNVYKYTAIEFADDLNGVVGAQLEEGAALYITSDGGQTWTTASGLAAIPYKINYVGEGTYFLVTNGGDIQKSIDFGATWTTVYADANTLFLGIRFLNSMIGIATAETNIVKTMDGGATWTSSPIAPGVTDGVLWRDVAWVNADHLVLVGTPDMIYESFDAGSTWTWANEAVFNANPALYEIAATGTSIKVCGSQGNFYNKSLLSSMPVAQMAKYSVENDQWTDLGSLGFQVDGTTSGGFNISGDGLTVVGNSWANPSNGNGTSPYAHAVAWSTTEGLMDLGSMFASINRSSRANAVNNDASVVVGYQDFNGPWKSAVWRKNPEGGYFPNEYILIDPAGNPTDEYNQVGECSAVSGDGNWIGGYGDYANADEPWIWSEATGVINLGTLGGVGRVSAINNDGSVVIGWFDNGFWDPKIPFIWTPTEGLQNLNTYITETLGFTMSYSPIHVPSNMSDNGKYIVGWGYDPTVGEWGESFNFRLQLPDGLGVNEVALNNAVNVYPNPVKDILNISSKELINNVQVFNVSGQQILTEKAMNAITKIDLSSLSSGVYFVKTSSANASKTIKVIKQ